MLDVSTDHVDFSDAALHSGDGREDFGDHAASDDFLLDEAFDLFRCDAGNEGVAVRGVTHNARHIGDIDELGGLQFRSQSCCGNVGVDI